MMLGSNNYSEWWHTEFDGINFGDPRLEHRFIQTAKLLAAEPTASINEACGNWKNTKASYRLFDNYKVDPKEIIDTHADKSSVRMKGEGTVLVIQDTSFFSYTEHFKTEGLGRIGFTNKHVHKNDCKGLIMHTALAVTTRGTPLGILHQDIWIREPDAPFTKYQKNRKRITIEEKESQKWLSALSDSMRWIPPEVQAVTVCDRESDLYEFIGRAEYINRKYLIRSSWNRAIMNELGEETYLWEHMDLQKKVGTFEVEIEGKRVAKQKVRPNRIAQMELRFSKVNLRRPTKKKVNREECLAYFTAWVVWVVEKNPPKGEEALNWMLLTNVPVSNFDEGHEKVEWYRHRWHIESFHKTLKSGCGVEKCRLQTVERLERFLTLSSIIAWRLYWITHMHREHPNKPCTQMLNNHEWKALYCIANKTSKIPKTIPTAREATRWIAQLGGFLARKGDGEPGIISVWRGWQKLSVLSEQWLILHPS